MLQRQFGFNVNRLRNLRELTQEQLAELANLSKRQVQRLEAGKQAPGLVTILALQVALDCTWDQLFADIVWKPYDPEG